MQTTTPLISLLLILATCGPVALAVGGKSILPSGGVGPYGVEEWKRDWPGCAYEHGVGAGRLALVKQDNERWWRVAYASGQVGPEDGGAAWRWPFSEKAPRSAELRYTVLFEKGFEFVKGGKLPGLCGGPKTITGGKHCNGLDGWSVRLMWRGEGHGQAYVYHPNMKLEYGDEFRFPDNVRFPVSQPVGIRMAVRINTVGRRDGSLRVWATLPGRAERLVVDQPAMEWTKDIAIGVDSILFNTFHGGNGGEWAPPKPCAARFGRIKYAVGD